MRVGWNGHQIRDSDERETHAGAKTRRPQKAIDRFMLYLALRRGAVWLSRRLAQPSGFDLIDPRAIGIITMSCLANRCGCSSMVERRLPKPNTRVRFPSPALVGRWVRLFFCAIAQVAGKACLEIGKPVKVTVFFLTLRVRVLLEGFATFFRKDRCKPVDVQ